MDAIHKYLVVPIVLACLSIAFILICLAVEVTRGRPSWVSRKLAVGAMIFALQSVSGIPVEAAGSCYERAAPPSVAVDDTMARKSRQILPDYQEEGMVEVLRVPAGDMPDIRLFLLDVRGNENFTYQLILGNQIVDSGAIKPLVAGIYAVKAPAVIHFTPAQLDKGMYLLKLFRGPDSGSASQTSCLAYGVLVE